MRNRALKQLRVRQSEEDGYFTGRAYRARAPSAFVELPYLDFAFFTLLLILPQI